MSWGNPQTVGDHFFQVLLQPLTWPYKLALDARQLAYEQNLLSATKLCCPVISVGNLTVGGTGKTPIIIDIARRLLANKIKVGILSRGYARRESNRCVSVGNGNGTFASLAESGDEPLLIAKTLPEAVVIVDKDRVNAGRKAIAEYKCQVLLLDDGFQHWRLKRDIDIVLIDYADNIDADALLPAGRLREPVSALSRATHIIITKVPEDCSLAQLEGIKKLANSYAPLAKISTCRSYNPSVERLISGSWQTIGIDFLNNIPVVAFCGLAKPKGFMDAVKKTGARVLKEINFPDHHHYSQTDLTNLAQELKLCGAQYFVTSRKDLVKLDASSLATNILAINQSIQWIEPPPDVMALGQAPIHQAI
jgi:tetraacyldisaccharide 4'-kinase